MGNMSIPAVPFTQYLMPDGRTVSVTIQRPAAISLKAAQLVAAGFHLECEMLSDYRTISLTVADRAAGEDMETELAPNGPQVPEAVDRLITRAHRRLVEGRAGHDA